MQQQGLGQLIDDRGAAGHIGGYRHLSGLLLLNLDPVALAGVALQLQVLQQNVVVKATLHPCLISHMQGFQK